MKGKNSKVIYTVITARYDFLFPPLYDQPGWDYICFTDNKKLKSKFWDVRPLPDLIEFASLADDPVRKARLVKILAHRFLGEYEYSVYTDANRVLVDDISRFVPDESKPLVCLGGVSIDPYSDIKRLIKYEKITRRNELLLSNLPALTKEEEDQLYKQEKKWEKAGLPEYCGCPGTALLGRIHNDEKVIKTMETWAKEVINGSTFDELSLPYACHKHRLKWVETLQQNVLSKEIFSEAEQVAVKMQHVRQEVVGTSEEKVEYELNPPPPGGEYGGYPLRLTIGVPVSNQIDVIRRCLEGIKPILDALPSELLVLDTGSTDGTIEVCREFGARVINFPWINDMSAARNTLIRAARGEWYLSIDDDEWFEDISAFLSFFSSGDHKDVNMVYYNQRNYSSKTLENAAEHPTRRMAKMHPSLHFEGRIHDVLTRDNPIRSFYLDAVAHHTGFAKDSAEETAAKSRRNISILRHEVASIQDDFRFAHQLMKEYVAATETYESIRMSYWTMSLFRQYPKGNEHWRLVDAGFAVHCMGMFENNGEEMLRFFERYIKINDYNLFDRCYLLFYKSQSHVRYVEHGLQEYVKAIDCINQYIEYRQDVLNMDKQERELLWQGISINSTSEKHLYYCVDTILSCYTALNKYDSAAELIRTDYLFDAFCDESAEKLRYKIVVFLSIYDYWEELVFLLKKYQADGAQEGLEYLYSVVFEVIKDTQVDKMMTMVEELEGPDYGLISLLELRMCKADDAGLLKIMENAKAYVASTLYATNYYYRTYLLYEAFRLEQDVESVFLMLDMNAIEYVLSQLKKNTVWSSELKSYLDTWHKEHDEAEGIEKYLVACQNIGIFNTMVAERVLDPMSYVNSFRDYVFSWYDWESERLKPQHLEEAGSRFIPSDLQAICSAKIAFEKYDKKDYVGAMEAIKTGLTRDANMKYAFVTFNNLIANEASTAISQLNEFDALLNEIKPRIRQLIAAGQTNEVIAMLSQIEKLAPNDPDIADFKSQVGLAPLS